MSIDEIRDRVKKTIAKVSGLKAADIGVDNSFDDLELDSLSRIEVLVELEREFQLDVSEDEEDTNLINEIDSVEGAVRLVQKYLTTTPAG